MKYTMENWKADGVFRAAAGQEVDDEVFESFLNSMMPEYWSHGWMQAGEPYGVAELEGKYVQTYTTFNGREFVGYLPSLNKYSVEQARKTKQLTF